MACIYLLNSRGGPQSFDFDITDFYQIIVTPYWQGKYAGDEDDVGDIDEDFDNVDEIGDVGDNVDAPPRFLHGGEHGAVGGPQHALHHDAKLAGHQAAATELPHVGQVQVVVTVDEGKLPLVGEAGLVQGHLDHLQEDGDDGQDDDNDGQDDTDNGQDDGDYCQDDGDYCQDDGDYGPDDVDYCQDDDDDGQDDDDDNCDDGQDDGDYSQDNGLDDKDNGQDDGDDGQDDGDDGQDDGDCDHLLPVGEGLAVIERLPGVRVEEVDGALVRLVPGGGGVVDGRTGGDCGRNEGQCGKNDSKDTRYIVVDVSDLELPHCTELLKLNSLSTL